MRLPVFPTRRFSEVALAVAAVAGLLATSLASVASAQTVPTRCEIIGTDGNDVLVGTAGNDIICGLGGDDIISGLGGDDEILGGGGADTIDGGDGNDLLKGDDGDDSLRGGPGDDELRGGNGNDDLAGGEGDDELRGGNQSDTIAGGDGDDELRGGNGDDRLRGVAGNDLIFGGLGEDIIKGGAGNDRLRGGPGGDICEDSFEKTNALTCEFGRGGDDTDIAIARQLWTLFGNTEFVYAMQLTQPCLGVEQCGITSAGETVHVRGDIAESSFGAPAFNAAELFAEADQAGVDGRKVTFDAELGLPRLIDTAEGATLGVDQIELRDQARSDFDRARALWAEVGVEEYSYTVSTSCLCLFTDPVRVTVSASSDVVVEPLGKSTQVWTGGAKTVDDHLDDLEALLDGTFIHVGAEFDETFGFPTVVSVDQSRLIADEERTVEISNFMPAVQETEQEPESDPPSQEPLPELIPGEEPGPEPDESPQPEIEPERVLPEIAIVSVRGIQVNEEIAGQVEALLAAADADGFTLSGGGFRDPQRQIELRRANCGTSDFAIYEMPARECNPPTARPGQSQHEVGLAIDFTSGGRLITSRSDTAFIWLAEHAPAFGFINLPSEPWHWSTTGN